MKRKSLSKKLRFTVFARDGFQCQYCGRTPPVVVLEPDHVVPVSAGGPDTEENLITACFDCNRGKAAGAATRPRRPAVPARTAEIAEAEEQLSAYRAMLQQRNQRMDNEVEQVAAYYAELTNDTMYLTELGRRSVRQWLQTWTVEDLKEAFGITSDYGKLGKYWFMNYIGGILRKWREAGRPER